MRQVVAHHTTYVGPQAVAHAVYVVRRCSGVREVRVKLSCALGHQPGIAQRRQVTREKRQRFPVHRKNVVVFSVQVSCEIIKKKKNNNKIFFKISLRLGFTFRATESESSIK